MSDRWRWSGGWELADMGRGSLDRQVRLYHWAEEELTKLVVWSEDQSLEDNLEVLGNWLRNNFPVPSGYK